MLNKYGNWVARALLALILIGAGSAKLAGVPEMHEAFALLGLPRWFGYFIGACEVSGAIGLFIRPLSALAAAGISVIMLGALYFHATHPPVAAGIPALVILALSTYLFTRHRADLFAFRTA